MLKWFKTLTNRLFGEDEKEENLIEEIIEEENIESSLEDNDIDEQIERPAFRFPIITDAEIYGWDEEAAELEHLQRENAPSSRETDDTFEPIPLYENERWPTNDVPVNIYRANPSGRNKNSNVDIEKDKKENEKSNNTSADYANIIKRKTADSFTPSKVPSPIYGFSTPPKENQKVAIDEETVNNVLYENVENSFMAEHSQTTVNKLASYQEDNEPEQYGKDLTAYETEDQSIPLISRETDEQSELIQSDLQAADEELIRTEYATAEEESDNAQLESETYETTLINEEIKSDIQEVSLAGENEYSQHNEEVVKETESVTSEIETIEEDAASVETEIEVIEDAPAEPLQPKAAELETVLEEEGVPAENEHAQEDSSEQFEKEQVQQEQSSTEALETEQEEVKKREKIVPFNVLMLKSDKRKLSAREPASAKKESAPKIVQPKDPVEKEQVEIAETKEETAPKFEHYVLPSMDYLIPPESKIEDTEWLSSQSEKLEESLSHFGVQARVIDAVQGPTVTRFELTVGQGTKVSRVRNLNDDLKLTLAARDIRIQAPIPGKSSIGIEIPNRKTRAVRISEVIQTEGFKSSDSPLEAVLGLGLTGDPVTLDLRKMPHGMIAGATGSGKSVCINSILVSLLYKASPADLQMMLIDPKMVELAPFNGIPHLISPVITDVKAATAALKWAVAEMERRYELLAHAGVRDIERFNKQAEKNRQFAQKLPYLLIVIDELADLMMVAPGDVEVSISRIAQKARACGIHLIIATQRPSVDVITGIIKANIPTRIAFSVSSQVDSRTMIDTNGAERLLGKGDMLYVGNGESSPVRLQGTFVTDDEIERIIEHVQHEASPTYLFGQDELLKSVVEEEEDPLFVDACQFIYEQDSASTSMLQRNFSIGYNRAAKLMDRMEKLGFISPQQGSRARDVYVTESDLDQLKETVL